MPKPRKKKAPPKAKRPPGLPLDGPKRISHAQKSVDILEMRRRGKTYDEIGAKYGIRACSVKKTVDKEIAKIQDKLADKASALIAMELRRLDGLFEIMYNQGRQGDTQAVMACIRIMERRAKLCGIDKPEQRQVEHSGPEGKPIEVLKLDLSALSDEEFERLDAVVKKSEEAQTDGSES